MKLTKEQAVQAYLASKGIAFANLNYVKPILFELLENGQITTQKGKELLAHEKNNASSILRLLGHIGIITKERDEKTKKYYYKIADKAAELYKRNDRKEELIEPLLPLFLEWLPLKIFIKFLEEKPECTLKDVKEILGEQVKQYTQEVAEEQPELGIIKGYLKPFNEMIIINVLVRMAKYLGLIEAEKRKGPYILTKKGNLSFEKDYK